MYQVLNLVRKTTENFHPHPRPEGAVIVLLSLRWDWPTYCPRGVAFTIKLLSVLLATSEGQTYPASRTLSGRDIYTTI